MFSWNQNLNQDELNETTERNMYDDINNNKNYDFEIYFENKPRSLRKNSIHLKCTKCVLDQKNCLLYGPEEKQEAFFHRFPLTFYNLFGILLLIIIFLNSFGEAASTVNSTIITTTTPSRGRWCQKVLKEERIREVKETRSCSENYNTSCGFFSYTTCTFTRYKICTHTYNHTFTISKSIMDCCPGWAKKDNDTCIELARKSKSLPSIHELSMGTFAAICSAGAFIMIIVFYIVKAVWKKKRKEKAAVECVHLEQLESLNAPPPPQQVSQLPPQPLMANPHGFAPFKSSIIDDHDVEAATADAEEATEAVALSSAMATPMENDQEAAAVKLLQKVPETQEVGATAVAAPSLAKNSDTDSKENLRLSDQPELQVELFIREEGDIPKAESQTQLHMQTLPENSKDDSQNLQMDPKI